MTSTSKHLSLLGLFVTPWMLSFCLTVEAIAQTDAECERLYGVTCSHQRDIERQNIGQQRHLIQQPTYIRQLIEQERQRQIQHGNGESVCIDYPTSMSCVASYYDNYNDFVASHEQYLATQHGLNTSASFCYTARTLKKQGVDWKQNSDRAFQLAVLSGAIPNTEFEYKLSLWRDLQVINKFCPDAG